MVELAVQLLGRGSSLGTSTAEENESSSRRRTSIRSRRKQSVQGAGLSLLGEFVQMVAVRACNLVLWTVYDVFRRHAN